MDKAIKCPLVNREISLGDCMDAAFFSEGIQPERFAPKELREVPNFKEICNDCPNHQE